jgi:chitin synthase
MIAAAFVLQLAFFIFGGMLGTLGWMIVWIMARPAYSFLMPLYAFWRMDDFSWGETRVSLDRAKIVYVCVYLSATSQVG